MTRFFSLKKFVSIIIGVTTLIGLYMYDKPIKTIAAQQPNGIWDSGVYVIKARHSGQTLTTVLANANAEPDNVDVANCADVFQKNSTGGIEQRWIVIVDGNGDWKIMPQASLKGGRVLDVTGASTQNNAELQIYDNNNTNAQRFKIENLGNGYYAIKTKVTQYQKALAVRDASTSQYVDVVQSTYTGATNQQWIFMLMNSSNYSCLIVDNNPVALESGWTSLMLHQDLYSSVKYLSDVASDTINTGANSIVIHKSQDTFSNNTFPQVNSVSQLMYASVGGDNLMETYTEYAYYNGKHVMLAPDVRINTSYPWGNAASNYNVFDLIGTLTHEYGHVVGLYDLYQGYNSSLTMFGRILLGEYQKRTLDTGDINGLRFLYN